MQSSLAIIIGASGGLGFEFSRQLALRGLKVVALSRSATQNTHLQDLSRRHSLDCTPIDLDPLDSLSLQNAVRQIESLGNLPVSFLINCCGVLTSKDHGPEKSLADFNLDWATHSFQVNALSHMLTLSAFSHLIISKQSRDFPTRVASVSARVASIGDNRIGGWYSYRATKSALNQYLKTASIELGRRHKKLVVASLHPGTVETSLSKPFLAGVKHEVFSPQYSVEQLLKVLDHLEPDSSGGFFDYAGKSIVW